MKKILIVIFCVFFYSNLIGQIRVDESEFSDNASSYVGKTITLVRVFYTESFQAGAWADKSDMTLRSKGDTFEDLYSMMNFYFKKSDGDDKYYWRQVRVDGNPVRLRIPKIISTKMPNTKTSFVNVTGVVKNDNTLIVKSITRTN
jgi:hypothetical protein